MVCWASTINSCRKITRAHRGPVFVVTRDPCTFPMQGSPECIFLCDQREGRVKHYRKCCFVPFEAKLIRGYKPQLSLPGRLPCTQVSTTEEGPGALGKWFKEIPLPEPDMQGAVRLLFYLVCFLLLLTLIFLRCPTQSQVCGLGGKPHSLPPQW